ncbi:LamG domain-containing protein [Spirosoma endophyticum]|uniref:3-keto-disaccharide hydrolase domain-containing protein n=1 Tax=Spirosoma endophyticum TaxID=662367 RepID=A0A1I1H9H3_9BACT|nr:hypothetical protein [Spirosoma endophyticum]SFC18123.1 hypothetical protein SAMN05216167_101609 [Spirosoma endophyticum]
MKALLLILVFASHYTLAQTTVPFDESHWAIAGKMTKETFQGKDGIRLTDGKIVLKDSTFTNGIIEFDMTLTNTRYFPGFGFRMQDNNNYEDVYLRPHRMNNPDAMQYMPVFNSQESWQLYHGDGYSATVTYSLDEWIHIKLVVRCSQAEVYVGDQRKPALVIHHLKREVKPGRIMLDNGAPAPAIARFANFQYTKSDNPTMVGTFKPEASAQPGTIMSWQISTTFNEKQLQADYSIPQDLASRLTWQALPAEPSGLINLSRIRKLSEAANAVFAKVTILSDKPQIRKFQFGFSDRVKVYCNGRLLYSGEDVFLSRDYRFLGTIGYFDEVYLDLKKGKNELWMAISEDFGGWGLKGIIADQAGLTIEP